VAEVREYLVTDAERIRVVLGSRREPTLQILSG
jgi:hypothetical protein